MKLRELCAAIAVTAVAVPLAAVAEPGQGVFYLNGSAGEINYDEETNLDTDSVYQIGGEYMLTDNLSAELGYGFAETQVSGTKDGVDLNHTFLNGYYYFGDRSRLQPYVSAGVGHADFDADVDNSGETFASAGVGARLHLTRHVSLRFDARGLFDTDESNVHEQYTVGVSYAFGVKDEEVPVAAVAAPVAVAAAPADSDGDGVIDDNDLCPDTPAGDKVNEKGCTLLTKDYHEERLEVLFAHDSDVVPDSANSELARVADFMKKYPEVSTEIEGHTDSDGKDSYNQGLSERRADAVRSALVTRFGIEPSRLSSVGYGESKPIASNSTAEGKAQNRRVMAMLRVTATKPVTQ